MNQNNEKKYNRITVAENAGFCFGVKRAVDLMNAEIKNGSRIYSIGELIHNRIFNEQLIASGVKFITRDDIDRIPDSIDSTIFIRAHGERKDIYDKLENSSLKYIDATCPYVKKIHKIVSDNIISITENNIITIIIGDVKHPEVEGIMSYAENGCLCFSGAVELQAYFENTDNYNNASGKKIIMVAQTTLSVETWKSCCEYVKNNFPDAKIYDTICFVTETRQKEVAILSESSELIVVVGGKTSSNTEKLYKIAKEKCSDAIHIESADELKSYSVERFRNKNIAITAGASTPYSIIQEVILKMTEIINEELSFAELLDSTFKTLNTGERVTGIISAISPAEIHVDLGIKHTGILPFDEITEDSSVDLQKEYIIGNPIDVIVVKFNDSEGTVLLSKKRIDSLRNWDTVNDSLDSGEIVYGKVKEAIKGGLIVLFDSLRVFIPASQSGVSANEDLGTLVGKKVPMKIIEVNKFKKRIIGSIRQATRVINKKSKDEFFDNVEVGQKFTGTVRSIVPYGVFVDLGGVDGMIHITQLTWNRIKDPSEVAKVGDKIDVFIREIDKEKKRISLGCKLEEDNPWVKFENSYKVGDILEAKIVNIFPFGAFAEIIPGVDGLIHISQISDKSVKNVADVLSIGETVGVKITVIKTEAHKVSLSIKALLITGNDNSTESVEIAETPKVPEILETTETTETTEKVEIAEPIEQA